MIDVNEFSDIRIGLATADAIRTWSNGEVKNRDHQLQNLKPEKMVFSARRSSAHEDWECACGKYKRQVQSIICERCGVEVTRQKFEENGWGILNLPHQ